MVVIDFCTIDINQSLINLSFCQKVIVSKIVPSRTPSGNRARLDLAMPEIPDTPPDPLENSTPTGEASFVTDAEMREQEKANLIAALRHANWHVWGPDGAAGLLGIKPSTLTYRMKVLGITKSEQPARCGWPRALNNSNRSHTRCAMVERGSVSYASSIWRMVVMASG